MGNYNYKQDYPRAKLKEAKKEFESEILPKIFECIEIVRQRHLPIFYDQIKEKNNAN